MSKNFKQLFEKLAAMKVARVLILLLVLLGLLFGFFKACTGENNQFKRFRIGRNFTWPALHLMGKEPNMQGFLDDLITAIAQQEKIVITIATLIQGNLLEKLDADFFDGVMMVVTPDPFMHEQYDISDPILKAGPVLVVTQSSKATSLKDLEGNGLGIRKGSPFLFKLNQNLNITFVPYENMFTALEELTKGNLAGVIMEAQLAQTFINSFYKDKLKILGPPLTDVSIRLVTKWNKKGQHLINHFNKGLKKLQEDGTYDTLVEKWTLAK